MTPLLEYYKVSFESDSYNILLFTLASSCVLRTFCVLFEDKRKRFSMIVTLYL